MKNIKIIIAFIFISFLLVGNIKATFPSIWDPRPELILKDSYNLGEPIEIKFNNSGPRTFYFSGTDGCAKFFIILNKDNTTIPISDPVQACTLALISLKVNPGETKIIGLWDQTVYDCKTKKSTERCIGHNVAPGSYKVKVMFSENPEFDAAKISIEKSIEIINNTTNKENLFIKIWNHIKNLFK